MLSIVTVLLAVAGLHAGDLPADREVREPNGDVIVIRVRMAPPVDGEPGVAVEQKLRVMEDGELKLQMSEQSEESQRYYVAACTARGLVPVKAYRVPNREEVDVHLMCDKYGMDWRRLPIPEHLRDKVRITYPRGVAPSARE